MYTTLFVKLNDSCLTYRRVTYLLLLFALDAILEWYFQLFCGFIMEESIGADFRFEVPGQSSVGLIGGGRGQWLGAPWRVRSTSL